MSFTDNPIADWDRYCAEQGKEMEKLPKCEYCGEQIQQDKAVYINGFWFCEDCEQAAWEEIRDEYLKDVTTD